MSQFEYHSPAPNSALLIYADPSAAQQALDASPIRFALERTAFAPQSAWEADEFPAPDTPEAASDEFGGDDNDAAIQPSTPGIQDMLSPSPLLTRTTPTPILSPLSSPSPSPSPSSPPLPHAPSTPKPTEPKWFQLTVDRSRAVHMDYVERQPFWKQFEPMRSVSQVDLGRKVPHWGLSDVSRRPPHAYRTPNRVLVGMREYVGRGVESLVGMWGEGDAGKREGR